MCFFFRQIDFKFSASKCNPTNVGCIVLSSSLLKGRQRFNSTFVKKKTSDQTDNDLTRKQFQLSRINFKLDSSTSDSNGEYLI